MTELNKNLFAQLGAKFTADRRTDYFEREKSTYLPYIGKVALTDTTPLPTTDLNEYRENRQIAAIDTSDRAAI